VFEVDFLAAMGSPVCIFAKAGGRSNGRAPLADGWI
jgi:hypothetical protein